MLARLRSALDLRPAPTLQEAEASEARTYGEPEIIEAYRAIASAGLTEIEEAIARRWFPPRGRVLDVGCGYGREAIGFAREGYDVLAIDVSTAAIAIAERKAAARVRFERCAFSRMQTLCGPFEAIFVSSDVYASIPGASNRIAALAQARALLAPAGVVAVAAAAREPHVLSRFVDGPRGFLRSLGVRCAEPGDRRVASSAVRPRRWVYRHAFSPAELEAELRAAGFDVRDRISSFVILSACPIVGERVNGIDVQRDRRLEDRNR